MKRYWYGLLASGLLFAVLMGARTDLWSSIAGRAGEGDPAAIAPLPDRDAWMAVFQDDRKIGFSHTVRAKEGKGYRIDETLFMRINTLGMVQDLHMRTQAGLGPDLTLADFEFSIHSGRFSFSAKGERNGEYLVLYSTGEDGKEQRRDVYVGKDPYIAAGMLEAAAARARTSGESVTIHLFDPSAMHSVPVEIRNHGPETVTMDGGPVNAVRYSMSFKGAEQNAWVDEQGQVVMEEGILGLRLEKTTREKALSKLDLAASRDLTETAAVPLVGEIGDPLSRKDLTVRIEGLPDTDLALDGGRQAFKDGVLHIRKETLDGTGFMPFASGLHGTDPADLAAAPFIQSDHPRIRGLAEKITQKAVDPVAKARKLVDWVYRNIEKRPVLSMPDAISTLLNREGDCNEHAVLLAALSRAAGIPAKVEAGLVLMDGRFYYHAWNRLFVGKWITADAVFGQFPADATHIRLTDGVSGGMDLVGVIGKIRILAGPSDGNPS